MINIKNNTISSLIWSFIDGFSNQGINFIFGIILARLLSPYDFGIMGILFVFIFFFQTFTEIGLTQALIRKKECTQEDLSTVFCFNLSISIFFYAFLFLFANSISSYFNEPQLSSLIKIISISLIFNGISYIHKTLAIKELAFKLQTKISFIASIISGACAVLLAYSGFGVWSLVYKYILFYIISTILLWFWIAWRPSILFDRHSFYELFSYGSKLLAGGLINTIYENIYSFIIGKYISVTELGFYSRAVQFQALPSQSITAIIQRVSFPILSIIQDDLIALKGFYKKLIKSTMFITFTGMFLLAAVAKPLILVTIGIKWLPSVVYLQLLCFVGIFYPLQALNLNIINVLGRSDLFLKLEIIKKIIFIPTIVIGIFVGIKTMILFMILNSVISYYLNSYWSGKFINYSISEQITDIFPSFFLSSMISVLIFIFGLLVDLNIILALILQIFIWGVLTIGLSEFFKMEDYLYLKNSLFEKLKKG